MNLDAAVRELMKRGRILVGLDFDGTLAPIVTRPDQAEPHPRAVAALERLAAHDDVDVVVVSGRAWHDLTNRLGEIGNVRLVGEHGNDLGEDDQPAPPVLDAARAFLLGLNTEFPGSIVERKPRSVTFHTRNLDRGQALVAASRIRDWAGRHDDISLLEGKEVQELTVGTRSKGDMIAEMAPDYAGVLFIGDDVTDETVFTVLGEDDVGVKVGPGTTSARYRVADVAGVIELLESIVLA